MRGRTNPGEKQSGGGSLGGTLRSLFGGGAKAGNGVAVYDISAAKVYMPDGSVLEAHSGIGKMADNPRYVDVKMRGPTPPHTYDLKMREKRFHGVEALRMLPVDGKNRNGRDRLPRAQLPAARRTGGIAWLRRLQGLRPFPQRLQAGQGQATRRGAERRTVKHSSCLRRKEHLTDAASRPQTRFCFNPRPRWSTAALPAGPASRPPKRARSAAQRSARHR